MNLGAWQLDTVSGGDFSIDAGAVYGVVPKTVWQKIAQSDELNRIRLRNNCVLARDGAQTVLIDTGYGGKYSLLDRKAYALEEGCPIVDSLAKLGVAQEQIDTVVLSHLHFDHAGGVASYDDRRNLVLTFPNARHVVGRLEWEDATSRLPELLAAYPQDNLVPLQRLNNLELIDDGATIVPGLTAIRTGGHTRGHLALLFESEGQGAIYPSDLCPTTRHARQLWCLAYDTFLLVTRRQKARLMGEAADRQWSVLWTHDSETAVSKIIRSIKREFEVVDCKPSL
ncbi:MAG: MBL fold metallo-hydrolase [Planctomycetota bacterium]|nr:MBL fold metallo-hydrolase [Planctomycetota bacterium]